MDGLDRGKGISLRSLQRRLRRMAKERQIAGCAEGRAGEPQDVRRVGRGGAALNAGLAPPRAPSGLFTSGAPASRSRRGSSTKSGRRRQAGRRGYRAAGRHYGAQRLLSRIEAELARTGDDHADALQAISADPRLPALRAIHESFLAEAQRRRRGEVETTVAAAKLNDAQTL
jgi:hypothetical protein